MISKASYPYLTQVFSLNVFPDDIYEKIRESDFLLSDEKYTHHLVGLM